MPVFQPSFSKIALAILLICTPIGGSGGAAMAREAAPPPQKPLEPMLDGDRLARLVKKITYEGLLKDPARLAAALGMEMTFTTKPALIHEKNCEQGGRSGPTTLTEATVGDSWYRAGPEGVPDMKVPQFMSDKIYIAREPKVVYSIFRSTVCKTGHEEIAAELSFADVSAYSCFTPARLSQLIGTDHRFYNHGSSGSTYAASPTDEYGTSLEFKFQFGAPCAVGITIRQEASSSARHARGFMKWRTCYDKARLDYCTANPGAGRDHEDQMNKYGDSICGARWMDYVDREPFSGEPAPPYKVVDDPCGTRR